jgi:hypothetical protein
MKKKKKKTRGEWKKKKKKKTCREWKKKTCGESHNTLLDAF